MRINEDMARRLYAVFMYWHIVPEISWEDLSEIIQRDFYILASRIETALETHPDAPSWQIDYLCQAYSVPTTRENILFFHDMIKEARGHDD